MNRLKTALLNPKLLIQFVTKKIIFIIQIVKVELFYLFLGQKAVSNYIRKIDNPVFILRYLGAEIGQRTTIWPGLLINCDNRSMFKHLKVGENAYILWDALIDLNDDVIIGDYAHIGAKSMLITHFNLGDSPLGIDEYPYTKGKIIISEGSVVSWGSTVLHGATIGKHTVISSGSIVSGEIPDFCVAVGNPARPIKKISPKNMKNYEKE